MNNYIKSISNLETDITESLNEPLSNSDRIPIITVSSSPPSKTEVIVNDIKNNEPSAEYLTPKTIKVKKYRLKK